MHSDYSFCNLFCKIPPFKKVLTTDSIQYYVRNVFIEVSNNSNVFSRVKMSEILDVWCIIYIKIQKSKIYLYIKPKISCHFINLLVIKYPFFSKYNAE